MGEFAMHRAAMEGDLERVRQLIEGGLSVDVRDDERRSPLHWAAYKGQYEVVQLLCSSNCDLNLKDRRGWTPVLMAADQKKEAVVDLLLQRGAQVHWAHDYKLTLLHYASENGWTDTVRHIGEADPNAATDSGETPLMRAASEDQEEVATLLIRAGADVNQSDTGKRTALHRAALWGYSRVVRVLLEKEGLDLNFQDLDNESALHRACRWGRSEVVKQLLEAGADATLENNYGQTALSEGIRRDKLTLEEIRLFVHHGAFLKNCDYLHISQNPVLKESVLKDVGLCTQSIVNKFHRHSLPALNSISYFARKLPNVDKFKLNARQIAEVENLVKCEIERNTFCNVVKAHPMALSALCVLSLITCQSATKRSASPRFGDGHSAFKKLHT